MARKLDRLGISFLELFSIVAPVKTSEKNLFANKNVYFFTDNGALVYIINKQIHSDKLIISLLSLSLNLSSVKCSMLSAYPM